MAAWTSPLTPAHLNQLRRHCGEVITPGDATYDDARRLWNAMHDRRPAVIVRPTTATKVATAIRFAREHDLEIVVRSGGHSPITLTGADGCLVVDLTAMQGVEVDPRTRIARSNGGALLGELDIAALLAKRIVRDVRVFRDRCRNRHVHREGALDVRKA